ALRCLGGARASGTRSTAARRSARTRTDLRVPLAPIEPPSGQLCVSAARRCRAAPIDSRQSEERPTMGWKKDRSEPDDGELSRRYVAIAPPAPRTTCAVAAIYQATV